MYLRGMRQWYVVVDYETEVTVCASGCVAITASMLVPGTTYGTGLSRGEAETEARARARAWRQARAEFREHNAAAEQARLTGERAA